MCVPHVISAVVAAWPLAQFTRGENRYERPRTPQPSEPSVGRVVSRLVSTRDTGVCDSFSFANIKCVVCTPARRDGDRSLGETERAVRVTGRGRPVRRIKLLFTNRIMIPLTRHPDAACGLHCLPAHNTQHGQRNKLLDNIGGG